MMNADFRRLVLQWMKEWVVSKPDSLCIETGQLLKRQMYKTVIFRMQNIGIVFDGNERLYGLHYA
jgi:hypothetical protein